MTFVLRRCFWMVDLGFTAVAATLCALLAGALIPHTVRIPEISFAFSSANPVAKTALDPKAASQVLGLPLDSGTTVVVEPGSPPTVSSLSVKLLGTSVSNVPELSLATLQDLAAKETTVYAIGDTIQGATVVDIERLRVTVDNHGQREVIDLEQSVAAPGSVVPAPPTATATPALVGITPMGPGRFSVTRDQLHKIAANPMGFFPGVFVAPAIDGGVNKGFKFSRVPADSLLTKLGVAQGDVVRRIDGYEVTDLPKLMEVMGRLATASQIGVEIEHNGASQRLSLRITD